MIKMIIMALCFISHLAFAESCTTNREVFIENASTKVWKTTLCPNQKLDFHVHHFAKVLIPEETGAMKVIYQSGKEEIIHLKKQIPIFLDLAQGKEPHQDETWVKGPCI